MGGALDPAPVATPAALQNISADAKIQHFNAFAADSQSPPVTTTIDPETFSPNSSPAKQNLNTSVLNHSIVGGATAAADTSVLNKSAAGWANAHKPTWSRDQDTTHAALNSSALNSSVLNASTLQVSEFTPQATPRDTPRENDKAFSPARTSTATAANTSANAGTAVGASSIHANKMNISREERALPPALRVDSSHNALNRSHAVNETLGVQDLSMVSFADSPELDHHPQHGSGAAAHKAPAPAPHVSKVQAAKGKVPQEAPSKHVHKSKGSSDTEGSDGSEEKITYPSAPGSSGALRMPTRTVSPPKPTIHTKPHELARMDSTGSSGGSWKSAQLTRSPDAASAPPPSKFAQSHPADTSVHGGKQKNKAVAATEGSGSDTAEETDGGEAQESERQRQQSKGPKLANSYDSLRSTPQRSTRQQTGGPATGTDNAHTSSSDEGDQRFMTTGTDAGSRRGSLNSVGNSHSAGPGVPRFSTESLPQQTSHRRPSQANHHSERSINELSVRSGELSFASPGSVHTAGELSASGGGSVKKRHIRTIQVGSPLNSSELNVAGAADDDNYLQEEQSEKGMLSQMAAEVLRSRSADEDHVFQSSSREVERDAGGLVEVESNSDGPVLTQRSNHHAREKVKQTVHKEASPTSRQRFIEQPHFTRDSRGSPEHPVHTQEPMQQLHTSLVTAKVVRKEDRPQQHPVRQQENNPEVMKLVNSLQERLRLLEAQVNLSTETDTFRKATQVRMEEQWTAEILALNLRNQQTFAENALLQQQLQTLKIECANTHAALAAAEASRKSLLVASSGLKDRAEHEALDTVIAQKRLIASLEKHLVECRKQAKKLEEDLGYMKNKHCVTATSLISWKAKAVELSTRQFGSTGGTVPSQRSHRSDRSRSPHGRSSGHHRSSENSSRDLSIMDQEFLDQLQESGENSDLSATARCGSRQQNVRGHLRGSQETKSSQHDRDSAASSGDDSRADHKVHIGSANESRIAKPVDTSRVEFHVDNTFHTNVLEEENSSHSGPHGSREHHQYSLPAAGPEGGEDGHSDGSEMDIDARRKVAERITRQYISKLPAPHKVSARLQEASAQLPHDIANSATHSSEPASTPYAMYLSTVNRIPDNSTTVDVTVASPQPFAPNPIYAYLLQHVAPPAPPSLQYRTNAATPTVPPLPTGGNQPTPTGAVLPTRANDLSERPDVTARAAAGVHFVHADGTRETHAASVGVAPQTLSDNDRYAALFLKRSRSPQIHQKQTNPYLSASQLYKSVPLSAEIEQCEQRLHSMTRGAGTSHLRSTTTSGSMYSTLGRSYNSDSYRTSGINRTGAGNGRFSATLPTNKSVDVYASAPAGPVPKWAQHQYL